MPTSKKPPKEGQRSQYIGTVAQFKLDDEQWKRLAVREED
jgi:hypothetical protein